MSGKWMALSSGLDYAVGHGLASRGEIDDAEAAVRKAYSAFER
jgi:hypothetical protein